jgi:hypothetical protein
MLEPAPITPIAIAAATNAVRGVFGEADTLTMAISFSFQSAAADSFSPFLFPYLPVCLPSIRRFGKPRPLCAA